jgi:dTDP-4-amino-4,6-dideoxygalactose transaminase
MSGIVNIPFFGIDRQYRSLRREILDCTDRVYASGRVLDGPNTQFFEQHMAKMCERRHAVAVNSGTQALQLALRSMSLSQHSNKILVPAISFAATVNAVVECGYDPVFCDVDAKTGIIDLNAIPVDASELAAIVYVNLYGNVVDWDHMRQYQSMWAAGLPILEDAAQSLGSLWRGIPSGKLGTVSCLSFDPTKNLNNYGSGGMVLCDDMAICQELCGLRDNDKCHNHMRSGTNSKMSEADCAQMLVKLRHFDTWQRRRTAIATYYTQELAPHVELPPVPAHVQHSWQKFAILCPEGRRVHFQREIARRGVDTRIHYAVPLHMLELADAIASPYVGRRLPGAELFSSMTLSLPIYPELTDDEVETVVTAVKHAAA